MNIIYYSLMKPSDMMPFPTIDFFIHDIAYSMSIPCVNRMLWIISNVGYRMPITFI